MPIYFSLYFYTDKAAAKSDLLSLQYGSALSHRAKNAVPAYRMIKSFLFTILSFAAVCLAVFFVFSEGVRLQVFDSFYRLISGPTSSAPAGDIASRTENGNAGVSPPTTPSPETPASASPTSPGTSKWIPPGFKGPTGQPRIKGPSAPPPEY